MDSHPLQLMARLMHINSPRYAVGCLCSYLGLSILIMCRPQWFGGNMPNYNVCGPRIESHCWQLC